MFAVKDQSISRSARLALVAGIAALTALSSGCSSFDLRQAAYQAIRQGDCRLNEPASACQANYQSEYQEYNRLREDFLRGIETASRTQ